ARIARRFRSGPHARARIRGRTVDPRLVATKRCGAEPRATGRIRAHYLAASEPDPHLAVLRRRCRGDSAVAVSAREAPADLARRRTSFWTRRPARPRGA